jgi:hypothetical protein
MPSYLLFSSFSLLLSHYGSFLPPSPLIPLFSSFLYSPHSSILLIPLFFSSAMSSLKQSEITLRLAEAFAFPISAYDALVDQFITELHEGLTQEDGMVRTSSIPSTSFTASFWWY